jgi:diguanylate cyclase (GGDEF)-like protein
MTDRWVSDADSDVMVPGATAMSCGPEHRAATFTLAALLVLGAVMGTVTLFVGGVLRDGAPRGIYAVTMAVLVVMAVPLVVRQWAGHWQLFGLVLLGDLIYVVVALCIQNPVRYATPLMLLFPAFVAACFLGPWQLGVNMVATTVACLVGLLPLHEDPLGLVIQMGVSAGTLNAGALGVFVLRRRVQRLLVATQNLTRLDPLTGLFNRRFLVEQAPRLWRQARRDGTRLAAMVLDLDHFKRLNDANGHAAGDAVLRAVADSLAAAVRPSDILARTGGEELVVLCLVGDQDDAVHLAERLRFAVSDTRTAEGHAVTASIGIALARPVDGELPTDALWRLVDHADAAMYEAKRQGRDRVVALSVPRTRAPLPDELPAVTRSASSEVA